MKDKHLETIEKSIQKSLVNDDQLIYIFEKKTYTEDEVREIGLNVLIEKYGPVKDLKREKSI